MWEEPFIYTAIDLNSVDVIELVETLDPNYPRHKYTFNFYKADASDAIITIDVSGIPKPELIKIWIAMLTTKEPGAYRTTGIRGMVEHIDNG